MRKEIDLPEDLTEQQYLFGANDKNLKLLRERLNIKVITRGEHLILEGTPKEIQTAEKIIYKVLRKINNGHSNVDKDIDLALEGHGHNVSNNSIKTERNTIEAKTAGQLKYINAIKNNGLVFAMGPAGTGKTFIATACAVEALRRGEVERLILTRPAVEAGESLGFLPGDLKEKVDPYLRPIYDALSDMLGRRQMLHYIDTGVIEIAPLAFMRGRTLNRSFVILDEAQNTLPTQMKMLLTRLGKNSRCIVNGDITQIDLANPERCGLIHATNILHDVKNVAIIHLQNKDVVRHRLVADIVKAYDDHEKIEEDISLHQDEILE